MGFLFLVLYPPPRPPARPPPHSLTSLTHTTHSLTHSLTCAFCVAGVAQSALPRGRMYALASPGSPPLLRGRRGTICIAKGSDVRPGVPWVSASFAWQAWDNLHCQGVGCTPWRPLGLRLFCVAGVGQCALPRGRMYALASLGSPPLLRGRRGTMCTAKGSDVRPGVPWVSASFAWQAWHNVHCQGVGCTPWRPLGLRLFCVAGVAQCALPRGRMYALASLGSPPLLRGRRGTMCIAKGSDVRPGVLGSPPLLRGRRGTMCTAKGVGCTPWRPLGLRLFCVAGVGPCAFCVAGVAQCTLPRDRMYGLASLGLRLFCVAGVGQCALPRGLDVRPGVPWAPLLLRGRRGTMCILRGRRGTMCTAKGSDVRPGVPWAPPLLRGRRKTMCTAKGLEYALASLGLGLFCVAGAHSFTHSVTHSVTHSLTPLTPSHSLTHTPLLAHSHSLTLTYSLTHSLTDTLSHTHTHSTIDGWMDRWTLT